MIRPLVGTAVYLATIALFSYALGALMRHSAAALATVLGLLLVAPILFSAIPWKPLTYMFPFLPGVAGQQLTQTDAQLEAAAASFTDRRRPDGLAGLRRAGALGRRRPRGRRVLLKKRDA